MTLNSKLITKGPFIVYPGFEFMLGANHDTVSAQTLKYRKHEPISAGNFFKVSYDKRSSFYKNHMDRDSMSWFAGGITKLAKLIQSRLKNVQVSSSEALLHCYICGKTFTIQDEILKVLCQLSGNCREFAQNSCNISYRQSFIIQVVFHNLSRHDSHFSPSANTIRL